jgi:hypothetical protein
VLNAELNFTSAEEPTSFKEAEQDAAWRAAMREEMKAIEDNDSRHHHHHRPPPLQGCRRLDHTPERERERWLHPTLSQKSVCGPRRHPI